MCGIAGNFAYIPGTKPVDRAELDRTRDAMVSRGPDGFGSWYSTDGRVGLAHRRLAIIDLSEGGAQPMVDHETGCVIAFNGEIYNYRELRAKLVSKGHRFRSESDTEVLLRCYLEHSLSGDGAEMLADLRGMFALAIWDPRRMGMLLARDQLGIKPLYIADDGRTLRFASQVKALRASGGPIDLTPDPAGQVGFFLWGYVPDPFTSYVGIRALPSGTSVWVDNTGVTGARPYWDLRTEIAGSRERAMRLGEAEARASLRDALADSVSHHLIADVPVGVFLSAGIDSTTVASLAAMARPGDRIRTLTLAFREFEGTPMDESPLAGKIAELIGAEHQTIRVQSGNFEASIESALRSMDQPTVDGVNTYFVSKAAHDAGLKVVLSGLGGDELFYGYRLFRSIPNQLALTRALAAVPGLGRGLRIALAPMFGALRKPKAAGIIEFGADVATAYMLQRALMMPWELTSVLDQEVVQRGLETLDPIGRLNRQIEGIADVQAQISALEMSCYMRDQLLRDSDWASMAHSIELRVPLVDSYLLRNVIRLRARGVACSKVQMCRAANPAASALIEGRSKTGFGIPVVKWMHALGVTPSVSGHPMRSWARFVHQWSATH
jgi:asparagine synthase (glutamine-hydrolysing)